MTAIRKAGKINANTTLIDIKLFDVVGVTATYLVQGEKSCLIDSGTQETAPRIYKALKDMDAFPPDYLVLTHAHWDHCQGTDYLRKKAGLEGKEISVFAGEESIPLLLDQSFNDVFHGTKPAKPIHNVSPLKEGEVLDLGGVTLKTFASPGHIDGHIALYDELNKDIFVGDALGLKLGGPGTFIPPFMPPFFNKEKYHSTINKLKTIDFKGVFLAHFGYIYGDEAKTLLDESFKVFELWWNIFDKANQENNLNAKYIAKILPDEAGLVTPDLKLEKLSMKLLLTIMNLGRKIIRKNPIGPGDVLLPEVSEWLIQGYKHYNKIET